MKKTLVALTLASLFMAGAAQAKDSAGLTITGSITDQNACNITISEQSVTLTDNISELIDQGKNATKATPVTYTINYGGTASAEGCIGNIALQITGNANADNVTLANSAPESVAAKGIGVGVYDADSKAMNIGSKFTPASGTGQINLQLVKLNGETPVKGSVYTTLTLNVTSL